MVQSTNATGPVQPHALDPEGLASRRERRDQRNDTWFRYVVTGCALFVLIALLGAALSMLWGGREAFGTFGWSFLWSSDWDAVQKKFGAMVPIYGTLVTALIAMIIAVPVSFGISLFLTEIAPAWMRTPVSAAVELLAGIPSIIYGMWGLLWAITLTLGSMSTWVHCPLLARYSRGRPSA
jgi:phosphate transport system permease protein